MLYIEYAVNGKEKEKEEKGKKGRKTGVKTSFSRT